MTCQCKVMCSNCWFKLSNFQTFKSITFNEGFKVVWVSNAIFSMWFIVILGVAVFHDFSGAGTLFFQISQMFKCSSRCMHVRREVGRLTLLQWSALQMPAFVLNSWEGWDNSTCLWQKKCRARFYHCEQARAFITNVLHDCVLVRAWTGSWE